MQVSILAIGLLFIGFDVASGKALNETWHLHTSSVCLKCSVNVILSLHPFSFSFLIYILLSTKYKLSYNLKKNCIVDLQKQFSVVRLFRFCSKL